jgi:hypothetical protein
VYTYGVYYYITSLFKMRDSLSAAAIKVLDCE